MKLTTTQLLIFFIQEFKPTIQTPLSQLDSGSAAQGFVDLSPSPHPLNPQAVGHRIGISNSYSISFISHQVIHLWLNL